ncbi:unnamed protein product [Adineta steineri]|uniref:Snake toxin/toxin-like domain-containing protein n=2 Tax=Adineta steineri TaxID=433720 RepID=A0A819LIE0_9BILA|nr:unnamed protein product [Adineta steineri]
MKQAAISTFLVLILLPMAASLACYTCVLGSAGCNDPFNSTGSGVTQTTSCIFSCAKIGTAGIISRSCALCEATPWVFGTGISCCSDKDYCNGTWRSHGYSFTLAGLMATFLVILKIAYI